MDILEFKNMLVDRLVDAFCRVNLPEVPASNMRIYNPFESINSGYIGNSNFLDDFFKIPLKHEVTFTNTLKQLNSKVSSEVSSDIILNIQEESDFYSAWEQAFIS